MYKQIDVSEVEEYIKNGENVMVSDFEEEDVSSVGLIYVTDWVNIKPDKSGRYVFAVKAPAND